MRKTIRPGVQLGVRHLDVPVDHRHRTRRPRHLHRERLRHQHSRPGPGVVPLHQHPPTLIHTQHVDIHERKIR
ncbi:hypothetical protein ACN6LI_005475, partial [Streptomyces violaceoruber]